MRQVETDDPQELEVNSNSGISDSPTNFKSSNNKKYLFIFIVLVFVLGFCVVAYNLWNFGTVKIGGYYINAWQSIVNSEAYFYFGKSSREDSVRVFSDMGLRGNLSKSDPTPTVSTAKPSEGRGLETTAQIYTEDDVIGIVTEIRDSVSKQSAIERGEMSWPPIRSDEDEVYDAKTFWFSAENLIGKDELMINKYFDTNNFEDLYGEVGSETTVSWSYQKDNIICDVYFNVHFPEDFNATKIDKDSLPRYAKVQCGLLK